MARLPEPRNVTRTSFARKDRESDLKRNSNRLLFLFLVGAYFVGRETGERRERAARPTPLESVTTFMRKYGHYVAERPTLPPAAVGRLAYDLIAEEYGEFITAVDRRDIIEIADALADLEYVTNYAAAVYGIDLDRVFAEVQRSNMTKSHAKNANGKTIKGRDFSPPNIRRAVYGGKNDAVA